MEAKELLINAQAGDLTSIETIAESFFYGTNGFEENDEQALFWFQKALEIDPNSATALTGLGNIYYSGYGVPVDKDKGLAYYLKGADAGSGQAAFELGVHFERMQNQQCIPWYEKAFSLGKNAAAYKLYRLYTDNEFVVTDVSKQLEWLEKGAEANNPECQTDLGCEYMPDGHYPQDYSVARNLWLAAANNGNGKAMRYLSRLYENGQGVEKNIDTAFEWARKALENGDDIQLLRYAFMYELGDGILPKSHEKAAELMQICADSGDSIAQTNMGRYYLNGIGVEMSYEKARPLFEAAAKQGYEPAINTLKECAQNFYGDHSSEHFFEVVKEGADNGYYECMVQAYICLRNGDGVPVDNNLAIDYLSRAVRGNYKKAIYFLGIEHTEGGLLQDDESDTAVLIFERIIGLGKPDALTAAAQNALSLIYREGHGVDKDIEKAIAYLESAANNGNVDAMLNIAIAHDDGGWADLDYEKACNYYARLVDSNNTVAINNLAAHYADGMGVPKDIDKAVELYEKSIQLGDVHAMTALAFLYQTEEPDSEHKDYSIRLLTEAARKGYPGAELLLGYDYYNGNGVTVNYEEAVRLWESAAEKGNSKALEFLATVYSDKSKNQFVNHEKAVAYFRPLAEQGNADAAYHLADHLEEIQAWNEAHEWYLKAAEGGSADAQAYLGISAWLEHKYSEALLWLQPAADQGNASALFCMAEMLMYGNSAVTKDETKAFQYYSKAAEYGNLHAMYQVGRCYYLGKGTITDYNTAFKWFSEAAKYGSDEMWAELGNCYRDGTGTSTDVAEAIKCYQRGVERNGDDFCRYGLGIIYADQDSGYFNRDLAEKHLVPLTNDGTFRSNAALQLGLLCKDSGDIQRSAQWLKMAAEENNMYAQHALGVIYYNGELGTRDFDRAEQYFLMAARNGHPTAASNASDCHAWKAKLQTQSQPQQQYQTSGSSQTTYTNDVAPKKPGGCYVATAVYGSYDCPEVWTLRRFRDFTLAETWYGRLFIRFYYAISPGLVRWFGGCTWFKSFLRPILDELVHKLKSSGYEDTPYNDKR